MARSRRQHMIRKITGIESEKELKQYASRKLRRACRQVLSKTEDDLMLHDVGTTDSWKFSPKGLTTTAKLCRK